MAAREERSVAKQPIASGSPIVSPSSNASLASAGAHTALRSRVLAALARALRHASSEIVPPDAVLAARELLMLVLSRLALTHGLDLEIKMLGRWAVWPTMFSLFLAMVSVTWVADALLYFGIVLTLIATGQYIADGLRAYRSRPSSSA